MKYKKLITNINKYIPEKGDLMELEDLYENNKIE